MLQGRKEANPVSVPRLCLDGSLSCVEVSDPHDLLFGLVAESLVGKDFTELLAPTQASATIEILRNAFEERCGALLCAPFDVAGTRYWLEMEASWAEPTGLEGARLEVRYQEISGPSPGAYAVAEDGAMAAAISLLAKRLLVWPEGDLTGALEFMLSTMGESLQANCATFYRGGQQSESEMTRVASWSAGKRRSVPGIASASEWLKKEIQAGRWVRGLPASNLPVESGELRLRLQTEGFEGYVALPCSSGSGCGEMLLELCWHELPLQLGPDAMENLAEAAVLVSGFLRREGQEAPRQELGRRIELLNEHRAEGYCEVEADGSLRFASTSLERLLGREPGGLLGESLASLIHPADVLNVKTSLDVLIGGGEADRAVFRAALGGGGYRWLEAIGTTTTTREGIPILVSVLRDVSPREIERVTLARKFELESLVAGLTRTFLEAESGRVESIIESSLETIAHSMAALRVRLLCFGAARPKKVECFQFPKPDGPDDTPEAIRNRIGQFPWGQKQLADLELIDVPNVANLPAEAAIDRASFEALGVASVLSVPAFSKGKVIAVLTVQNATVVEAFPEHEKRLLRVLAEIYTGEFDRQRSEHELRSSEERFRALAENMRDSICEIGEDGRILFVSPSYADLFGGTQQEFEGGDPLAPIHPEDRQRVSLLFKPGAHSRGGDALVYRAQTATGRGLHLEATASEFEGYDGRPRVVVATRDVTERENARIALDRQIRLEARVAELSRFFVDIEIDSIGAGVESRLAVVGELAGADHCWMYSFPTGKDGFELFDWWREGVREARPVAPDRSIMSFPYSTGLITSGQIYHVPDIASLPEAGSAEREDMLARGVQSILGIPIMSGGRFVGCLGFESFDREITWTEETIVLLRMAGEIFYSTLRRRRAARDLGESQSQLMQSQKMEAVGTLAGGIAHDFNNHLAVMLANARFLRQEMDGPSHIVEAIDDVERSADHCAQLTRSLLAFSRQSPVEVLPVEVDELLHGVEGLVRPLLPGAIDFRVTLKPPLGRFVVDRVQIQQVLVNLLVNARDSMPEGGPLRLRASRRALEPAEETAEGLRRGKEYIVLCVEDAGFGMDEETRSRVFEPFFTTKELGRGTGLGLAMAYGIIRQSEGAITVQSEPGRGTTFRVYLPAHTEGGPAPPATS